MARNRQPTDLLLVKGRKHLTKSEIEARKNSEVKANNDKIKAPDYLSKDEKKEFKNISKELIEIGIMSNLDIDSLSFFIKTRTEYLRVTSELESREPTKKIETKNGIVTVVDDDYERLLRMQLKILDTCRKTASDLGLSISSRCKLVVPKQDTEKPQNKFTKFM